MYAIQFSDASPHKIIRELPPYFIFNFQAPGYPAANPIWGKVVDDGKSYTMLQIFVIEEWVLQQPNNPAVRLLHKIVNSPRGDPIHDRIKGLSIRSWCNCH